MVVSPQGCEHAGGALARLAVGRRVVVGGGRDVDVAVRQRQDLAALEARRAGAPSQLVGGLGARPRPPGLSSTSGTFSPVGRRRRRVMRTRTRRRRRSSVAVGILVGDRRGQRARRVAGGQPADRVDHGRVDQPGDRLRAGGDAEVDQGAQGAARREGRGPRLDVGDAAVGVVQDLAADRDDQGGVDRAVRAGRTSGRKVRARPSANSSPPASFEPSACTPNQ